MPPFDAAFSSMTTMAIGPQDSLGLLGQIRRRIRGVHLSEAWSEQ